MKNPLNEKKRLVEKIITYLSIEFPEPKCELHYKTPEQLLFATILSAQCTDKRVNMVTPKLFQKYPSSQELAKAKQSDVEKIIQSTGFFRNKAKNLIGAAKSIQSQFSGTLPRSIEELTQLAGVGRKTANVVLGDAFHIQVGVVVDTHVRRISNLLGLTQNQDPIKIEQDLMEIVPKKNWTNFSHWLILHGRRTCIARRPKCQECVLQKICEYGKKEVSR